MEESREKWDHGSLLLESHSPVVDDDEAVIIIKQDQEHSCAWKGGKSNGNGLGGVRCFARMTDHYSQLGGPSWG
jgi:hypothetical protein